MMNLLLWISGALIVGFCFLIRDNVLLRKELKDLRGKLNDLTNEVNDQFWRLQKVIDYQVYDGERLSKLECFTGFCKDECFENCDNDSEECF